jgi:hypothetical protein
MITSPFGYEFEKFFIVAVHFIFPFLTCHQQCQENDDAWTQCLCQSSCLFSIEQHLMAAPVHNRTKTSHSAGTSISCIVRLSILRHRTYPSSASTLDKACRRCHCIDLLQQVGETGLVVHSIFPFSKHHNTFYFGKKGILGMPRGYRVRTSSEYREGQQQPRRSPSRCLWSEL